MAPAAVADALRAGRRFAVLNAWRNVDAASPVRRAPLALFATRYDTEGACFPRAAPDPATSLWYAFPRMTAHEVLLFKQYDRDAARPADLWHCALPGVVDDDAPPRRSFELRVFVLFSEDVPPERDRLAAGRHAPRAALSREESECFCGEQAAARGRRVGVS
mmetsp:Transcript_4946/g.20226  ORF Transcript_4946/g.20226 Transcript_4946/m.20226 type:complete len:162 (+) Transcript_4946:1699-2184(+)